MKRTTATHYAVLFAHALVGWAWCGAIVGVGRQHLSMDATLVLHAVLAPSGFALLSLLYHRVFGYTPPLRTASFFIATVIVLDALVVAPLFEGSYAMFASPLGTWIPFALIFAASWATGRWITTRQPRLDD